ncbi:MAG: V-type ATP synthase subunit A, partial [Lentisphaeria bacterium]|nr:V-type ATP synthase subunit A [Lentisphaeria bacterium]
MPEHNRGRIVGVNGNLLTVEFDTSVIQNEVAFVILGDLRLKSEVIRVRGNRADLQVFESTDGIKVGDIVEFSGSLLSVTLGPGLLKQVFDGLQNPLPMLAEKSGFFLQRGVYLDAFDFQAVWDFTPLAEVGAKLRAG